MVDRRAQRVDDQVRELVALGKEHFQRGEHALAAGHLEQVVARGVDLPDVHFLLGCIQHHLGEFEAAQLSFSRSLELNPAYVEAALNLAIVCNDMGQHERAQEVYGKALALVQTAKRDPAGNLPLDSYTQGKLANLHANVADAYASVQRPAEAAAEYRRALALCPGFVDLRIKLAHVLRDAGDVAAAREELQAAVRGAPAYLPARVALGIALYAGGDLGAAIVQWEEVIRADPQHRTAAMYLKLVRSQSAKKPGAARGSR
jgi:tetratricopeptide (TPR) repeat protein